MNWTKNLQEAVNNMGYQHKNIRMQNALVSLFNNLDDVPVEKIEALTNKPVVEPLLYQYDILLDGKIWYPIADDKIPDMNKVPGMIERGLMRKHVRKS